MKCNPVGTDQLLKVDSTLSLNFPQPSSKLIFGWEIVDFVTITNRKSTYQPQFNQKSISLKLKCQCWKMVEIWLTIGWFSVDFMLRSWFLVDHCYKITDFSTKYQCWYLVEKLICAHREIAAYTILPPIHQSTTFCDKNVAKMTNHESSK